jgi:hypothetical protein
MISRAESSEPRDLVGRVPRNRSKCLLYSFVIHGTG